MSRENAPSTPYNRRRLTHKSFVRLLFARSAAANAAAAATGGAVWPLQSPLHSNASFSWGFTVVHDEEAGIYHGAVFPPPRSRQRRAP